MKKKKCYGGVENLLGLLIVFNVLLLIFLGIKTYSDNKKGNINTNISDNITSNNTIVNNEISNNEESNTIIDKSKMVDMTTDISILSNAISSYEIKHNELPLQEGGILKTDSLTKSLEDNQDDYDNLKIIDLEKTKNFHTKLLLGYEKEQGDKYLYSIKTKKVYYEKGLDDGNGNIKHTR